AGAHAAAEHASHHLGRLVDGGAVPRADRSVCRFRGWAAITSTTAADPVRGLCGVAAGAVAGRGARTTADLLALSARLRPRAAPAAHGLSTPSPRLLPRRHSLLL